MLIFAIIVITVFLTLGFLFYMSEVDGWSEIKYWEYSWKNFFKDQQFLKKDMEYAIAKRDIYTPNKKKDARIKDEKAVVDITIDKLFDAIAEKSRDFKFDYSSISLTSKEIKDIALKTVRDLGYNEATTSFDANWTVRIVLNERP